jgi:hypothetical protein
MEATPEAEVTNTALLTVAKLFNAVPEVPFQVAKVLVTDVPGPTTYPSVVGAAHTPSPRQKVVAVAAAPEFRFVTGRLPTTPPDAADARLMGGMSALTRLRKQGTPNALAAGPQKTRLCAWGVRVALRLTIPLLFTFDPVTTKMLGNESPT